MPKPTRFQPKSFAEQEEELNRRVMEEVQANPIIGLDQQPTSQPVSQVVPQSVGQQPLQQPVQQTMQSVQAQMQQPVQPMGAQPVQQTYQQVIPQNVVLQNGIPVQVPVYTQHAPIPYPMEQAEVTKNKGGRKKSNRTIKRENGLTIFLEDAHNEALNNLRGTDKQEVIRVALDEFIQKYYSGGRFNQEAYDLIFDYIDRTTSK